LIVVEAPQPTQAAVRPERIGEEPLPAIPDVDRTRPDEASVEYSHYRTTLSRHRTGLSEHRTDLSEFRTDLSGERTEMSMRRTGMSFQRTRMSADRTLMSVIRTSLSLIGFGFTIQQAFAKLRDASIIHHAAAPRNFGVALILLGVLLLAGGIWRHIQFSTELRHIRGEMAAGGLIHAESSFPVSATLIVAAALFSLGLLAVAGIVFDFPWLG
jgi:uncharacterized membrane protein YidH (DUF202 family)